MGKDDITAYDNDSSRINCNYVDIESFNYPKKKRDISLFHMNIASLSKHKEELDTILSMLDHRFDFI